MSDAPERIWRVAADIPQHYSHGLASWPNRENAGDGATEYLRADLHDAEVERLSSPREWQPIETAPRDGTEALLRTPCGIAIGVWEDREDDCPDQPGHDAGWYANGYSCDPVMWGRTESAGFIGPGYIYQPQNQPTHWMPLPKPPQEV